MSKNITVSDELYLRLQEQAARQGQGIETYLDRLTASPEPDQRKMLHDRLAAKGLLISWPNPASTIADHPPVVVEGPPLSQTIIEDRR
jgi:hypothetical protein